MMDHYKDSSAVIVSTDENELTSFERFYFKLVQNLSVNVFENYCQGEVEGLENIYKVDSGFILACNHASYLDWLVLYSIFKNRYDKEIVFLAKERLYKSFIFRKLIKAANCIKVTDAGLSISSMRKIYRKLRQKGIIGIFPEGTRSYNGELLQAKDGVAKIAVLTGAPIIPVGIEGLYEVWSRHKLIPTGFSKCKIKIGNPIYINQTRHDPVSYGHITGKVMTDIGRLIGKKYIHPH
ncbi:MAG: 1-acyl-sn-glycerol-3-phosphate acyltransferase [Candidatus Saganbacteria bacterium]|nr:1-acyl-sn-glycerol-3-phosphate acyltransferase [Candidatus Saganbacteria bacterium]